LIFPGEVNERKYIYSMPAFLALGDKEAIEVIEHGGAIGLGRRDLDHSHCFSEPRFDIIFDHSSTLDMEEKVTEKEKEMRMKWAISDGLYKASIRSQGVMEEEAEGAIC